MVILIKALQLVLALSILVIVHEFGHFIFARIFKVRVEKFYLFFNPWFSLFKFKPKGSETEYGIGWLPLGGYVKIAGMIDESMDKEQMAQPAQPWEFRSKSAFARLMIMIGGVLFNFILAILIYAGIAYHWGDAYLPLRNVKAGMEFSQTAKQAGFEDGDIIWAVDGREMVTLDVQKLAEAKTVTVMRDGRETDIRIPDNFMQQLIASNEKFASERVPFVVSMVEGGSNAAKAGPAEGDSLLAINGVPTPSLQTAFAELQASKGDTATFTFMRAGEQKSLPVVVSESGKIGVGLKPINQMFDVVYEHYTLLGSIPVGVRHGVDRLVSYVSSLKYVFTKEGAQSLGGFVAIGNIFPSQWNWLSFWEITAFLSVMLGFMNIIPIPALDGGHVCFLLYEVITRRKPSEKFMEYAQMAGMALLFALLIFANGNDLFKLFFK